VQEVWLGVTADLSSVVSNIQEIFSLGIPEVAAVQATTPVHKLIKRKNRM
jgi:hypothetical protein